MRTGGIGSTRDVVSDGDSGGTGDGIGDGGNCAGGVTGGAPGAKSGVFGVLSGGLYFLNARLAPCPRLRSLNRCKWSRPILLDERQCQSCARTRRDHENLPGYIYPRREP